MKCIKSLRGGRILRVTDAEAAKATRGVAYGTLNRVRVTKWVYVPKSEWRAYRDAKAAKEASNV